MGKACNNKSIYEVVATSSDHQALNKRLATNAVVLLKNEAGILPLQADSMKTIAVLGSACDAKQDWANLHDWTSASYYNIGGSGRVIPVHPITILNATKAKCAEVGCTVVSEILD